jgi:hypothetical protein
MRGDEMSEAGAQAAPAKPKRAIDLLRDRQGGIKPPLKEAFNEQQRIRKALKQALQAGMKTVPELAQETGLPSPTVLWHLMAMRRYGDILDGPEQDGYLLYRLKGA